MDFSRSDHFPVASLSSRANSPQRSCESSTSRNFKGAKMRCTECDLKHGSRGGAPCYCVTHPGQDERSHENNLPTNRHHLLNQSDSALNEHTPLAACSPSRTCWRGNMVLLSSPITTGSPLFLPIVTRRLGPEAGPPRPPRPPRPPKLPISRL